MIPFIRHTHLKQWLVVLAVALMAGATVLAADEGAKPAEKARAKRAQADGQRPQGPRARGGRFLQKVLGDLNLSDEQKGKVKEVFATARKEFQAKAEKHKDELAKLREEFQAARQSKDREKLAALAKKRRELMGDGGGEAILAKIKAVLTDEQKKQFDDKLAEAKAKAQKAREQAGQNPAKKGDQPRKRPQKNQQKNDK